MGYDPDGEDEIMEPFIDGLEEVMSSAQGPADVVRLIELMREGLAQGKLEHIAPSNYFDAMEGTLETLPGNCAFQGIPCPDPPDWQLVARMLDRAMVIT